MPINASVIISFEDRENPQNLKNLFAKGIMHISLNLMAWPIVVSCFGPDNQQQSLIQVLAVEKVN